MKISSTFFILCMIYVSSKTFSKSRSDSCPSEFSCPSGQTKKDNGTSANPNGCGPLQDSLLTEYISKLGSFVGSEFTECCNDHDECYGKCGADKSKCDKIFLDCMKNVCKKKKNIVTKTVCKGKAESFYLAVDKSPKCFFNKSQHQHCQCVSQ